MPIGSIITFTRIDIPNNYLLCDGSEISRITYNKLFTIISTNFGEGDNETTFNLPLLTDNRYLQGSAEVGNYIDAGLPNIEGCCGGTYLGAITNATGAFFTRTETHGGCQGGGNMFHKVYLNASLSSSIYNKSTTVTPLSLTVKYLIKYN